MLYPVVPCSRKADLYDPVRKRVYLSGGGGAVSVIDQQPTGAIPCLGNRRHSARRRYFRFL